MRKYRSQIGWLVGFVALRPKSTAMVIAGRSVHLTTLFLNRCVVCICNNSYICRCLPIDEV